MTSAPGPGAPSSLGPFQLRERLAEHSAGAVFLAHDEYGRAVAIAVPHTAAAADAALRDRFAGAVHELAEHSPVHVLADAAADPVQPWAALAYEPGTTPTEALGLLDAAGLTTSAAAANEPAEPAGPDFAPHWSDAPGAATYSPRPSDVPYAPPGGSGGTPHGSSAKSVLIVIGLVLLGVLVVAAAGWFAWTTVSNAFSDDDLGSSSETRVEKVPDSGTDSGTDSGPVPNGPPGPVAGPTYGEDESTDLMTGIFDFDFAVPNGWGCLGRDDPSPKSTGVTCIDEGGTFPPKKGGAGGIIEVTPCPPPCGEQDWQRIREYFPDPETAWEQVDESTLYAQTGVIETADGSMVGLRMSHVYAASGDGPPDHHLAVRLAGKPADLEAMQKLVNELRTRTP